MKIKTLLESARPRRSELKDMIPAWTLDLVVNNETRKILDFVFVGLYILILEYPKYVDKLIVKKGI